MSCDENPNDRAEVALTAVMPGSYQTGHPTDGKEAMGRITKNVFVFRVKRGAAFSDHLHLAKPGLERCLHVLVTPLLNRCPFPPACTIPPQYEQQGPVCIVHLLQVEGPAWPYQ